MRAGGIERRGIFAKCVVLLAILVGFLTWIPAGFAANPEISTIVFNPTTAKLANPDNPAGSTPPRKITLRFRVYDAFGNLITPSSTNPVTINVYGAPTGVITMMTPSPITSGNRVTFAYNGQFFPNPITVEAYVPNGLGGYSIGVTQILPRNQPSPCAYGTESFTLPFDCGGLTGSACTNSNIANGLNLMAAIGYNDDTKAGNNLTDFAIDTGSRGALVPASWLGPDAIGPAGPGVKFYDSSGNTFAGNYYLARISFKASDGSIVKTIPIKVLGVTAAYCAPGNYPNCNSNPPGTNIFYLGVGFDRNSTTANDDFNSPADNAFLQIDDDNNSTNISPGYVLNGDDATVGITSTSGYGLAALTANRSVPGDWNATPGCYGFPTLPGRNQFCGTLLMDVGITEMFLDLPPARRPADAVDPNNDSKLPKGLETSITAGTAANPAMSYTFDYAKSDTPTDVAPTDVTWVKPKPGHAPIFVNTGRDVLFGFNYMYDASCGNTGFEPLPQ
jgi:hypothetical protein